MNKHTYRDDQLLGSIYCPDHGWQPMYGLMNEKGEYTGAGCQKHYQTLPIFPSKAEPKTEP